MPDRASAEEVYSRCLGNATTLDQAAHRYADAGDAVSALATAWGSDLYAAQAILWERIMVAATMPQRQFFRVAEALTSGLGPSTGTAATVADAVAAGRASLLQACEPGLASALQGRWTDPGYLAALPAPTVADLDAAVGARLEGLAPAAFVERRRADAAEAMARAQALRIKGETRAAIEAAYESDFGVLQAYLVESARAAGDEHLLTMIVRWELATHAVASLPGLPEGFLPAITQIRRAMADGLGDADGARLLEAMLPA